MKLNNEELNDLRGAITAALNGDPVEAKFIGSDDEWNEQAGPQYNFLHPSLLWRAKPKLVTRPWSNPDDIPAPVCFICYANSFKKEDALWQIIQGANEEGVWILLGDIKHPNVVLVEWKVLYDNWLCSIDRKTWRKCEVVE